MEAESAPLADDASSDKIKVSGNHGDAPAGAIAPSEATDAPTTDPDTSPGQQVPTDDAASHSQDAAHTVPQQEKPSLEKALADLQIPPPWLNSVVLEFDTTQPWK
ncbi:MAG: hypothetical protein H8E44_02480 [Planctomycetes bacterium]|nr:hypothetical protein [Planctomycetota bacterium]